MYHEKILEPNKATENFDVIVLGGLIEHLGNPVDFFKVVIVNLEQPDALIVITISNDFSPSNVREILHTRENINTDHRFWFTP